MSHDAGSRGAELSRRGFLGVAGGAALAAGAAPPASAQEDPFDGWMDDVSNYEGVVDRTGEDEVGVEVGAGEDGLLFAPPAIRVDPGTTVVWEWTGAGGAHNVVEEDDGAFESELVGDEEHTFDHTFGEEGIARYKCEPHVDAGMKGVVVVGDAAPDAPEASGGGGGGSTNIPLLPGVGAALAIIVGVTIAVQQWLSARNPRRT